MGRLVFKGRLQACAEATLKGCRLWLIAIMLLLLSIILATASYAATETYDTYKIYYNNRDTGLMGFYVKGTPYMPVSAIESGTYLAKNSAVSVDVANMKLTIDTSKLNILMADDETTDFIKKYAGTTYIPLKKLNDVICFPLNAAGQFFNVSSTVKGGSIKLTSYTGKETVARVNSAKATACASLLDESASADPGETLAVSANQRIYILEELDNLYKFKTSGGDVGYIDRDYVTLSDVDLSGVDFYAPKKDKFVPESGEKFTLAWHYASTGTPAAPAKYKGLDIMAPTWFHLIVNGSGNVKNTADKGYSDLCHERGYMVWATVTNSMSTKGSTNFTTTTFNTAEYLYRSVAQYIFYACLYDADGINIDYEDVKDADAAGLVEFTKLLCEYANRQGLVTSIDTLIPSTWSVEYDRDALAEYVDYLAIMAYDEHYSGSTVPGSVSSIPWVETAIQATIDEGVPAEKILLGVPMYTRVWCVNSSGKIVTKNAASMTWVQNKIKSAGLTTTYLESKGQNYVEYTDSSGNLNKIWIEDATSMKNRANLVNKYGLAGAAAWQYTQATSDIWSIFYNSF